MSTYDFVKIRAVDVKSFMHQNQPVFFLRDPLQLSPQYVLVPQYWGPVLASCDGTRTLTQVRQQANKMGLPVSILDMERMLSQLDQVYLLENDRFTEAKLKSLQEYRNAPYRIPFSAGLSYPADPSELRQNLQHYVDQAPPIEPTETGAGLFSPHIDYQRGGIVYAQAWKRVEKLAKEADCVVIFGTDHNSYSPGQITPTRQHYATPFGVLPTNQNVVDAIVDVVGEDHAFAEEIHHRQEHSIELVVTWLHFIRNGEACPIVPILCGSFRHFIADKTNPADSTHLNNVLTAIKKATAGQKVLVVASGDLAHLGPAFDTPPLNAAAKAQLKTDDEAMLEPLLAGNADSFFEIIRREKGERNVCGTAPFYLTLKLMQQLSGNVTGEMAGYDRCLADEQETSFVSVCGMVFA